MISVASIVEVTGSIRLYFYVITQTGIEKPKASKLLTLLKFVFFCTRESIYFFMMIKLTICETWKLKLQYYCKRNQAAACKSVIPPNKLVLQRSITWTHSFTDGGAFNTKATMTRPKELISVKKQVIFFSAEEKKVSKGCVPVFLNLFFSQNP